MSDLDFTNDKSAEFEALPAGKYGAIIVSAEVVDTKSGKAIKTKFQVIDDERKGTTLYHYFNHINSNEMAQKIGRGQIKDYCTKVKISPDLAGNGVESLCGHRIGITVKNTQDEVYGKQAQITSFQDYVSDKVSQSNIPF
jgi:hypothetical protein